MVKVDEAASTIFDYLMDFNSNERTSLYILANEHLVRSSSYVPMTHTFHCTAEVKAPQSVKNRVFTGVLVWDMGIDGDLNSFNIAMVPDEDDGGITHPATSAIVGSTCGIFVFNALVPRVSTVTLIQTTDLKIKGTVGDTISNYTAEYSLAILDELFEKYRRDERFVDSEMRHAFVNNIEIVSPLLNDNLKQECIDLASAIENDDRIPLIKLKKTSCT